MAPLDYQYIASIVNQLKNGDSNAFAELYAATYKKQYRFACNYLKDEYLAQDALQETYLLALKNIDKLKDNRVFVSWLNQISFRVCFNMQQKLKQHHQELRDDVDLNELVDNDSDEKNPESIASTAAEKEEMLSLILKLPRKESQAIIMKYYNNMKLEDIAHAMDCSRSTVKRYIINGREHLQEIMKSSNTQ